MSQQQSSNRLTKHPPHKLPPTNNAVMSCSPLPSPSVRMSSFSKRHASFDSPREIPLPSPSQNSSNSAQYSYFPPIVKAEPSVLTKSRPSSMSKQITENGFSPIFDETEDEAGWTSVSNRNSGAEVPSEAPQPSHRNATVPSSITSELTSSSQIHPYSRPYSVPHSHSDHGHSESLSVSTKHKTPTAVDRMSSASLPLPTQIPFHALPKVSSQGGATGANTAHKFGLDSLVSDVARSSTVELEEENENHRPTAMLKGSDGDSDTSSLPSVSSKDASRITSRRGSPAHDGKVESLPKESLPRPLSHPNHIPNYPHLRDPPQSFSHHMSSTPPSAGSSLSAATALRRSATITSSGSSRSIPPPQPPIILPSPPLPPVSLTSLAAVCASASESSSYSTLESSTSGATTDTSITSPASACNSQRMLPPRSAMVSAMEPPYAPFLSHSPPPADSWIEVETTPSDYKLNVRLPGFQRDGITLATKKRRILHVVADSWGTGGGHFERRISFGYDADLAQVRAEFDGEMLRVIVPRRMQPAWGSGAGMGYAM